MKIIDLTVTIGPGTLSPPSVNRQLTLTPHYLGPGYWRASSVDVVLHTGLQSALDSPPVWLREDAMAHAEKRIHLRTEEHAIKDSN